ncbi:phospholipase effector Tle1 domain-containing protein [Vibrio salinus]|uniref:phospholipase effector Tle1 domain-containing protein n=1 Tax=Vibrio salinus TaxID=2899784 RepID=UPI001E514EB9|nr:DUF2235 domain-containing protein [Vibrio salinus]MCE0492490.1 DUF2235 domain-containing protein [Vibrio salinus]
MSSGVSDQHCVRCEKLSHWIEILVRDEHNKPFNNIPGILTDAVGNQHKITLNSSPILLTRLAAGIVTLTLDYDKWITDAQDKKRKPNPDEEPTAEYAQGYVGYKKTSPKFVKITAGDLTEIKNSDEHPEQNLPQRHLAGQAETLKLVTDKSYVLEVRAFNYITLRIGAFFDGTANNTYSAEWGKKQFDAYKSRWRALYTQDKKHPCTYSQVDKNKFKIKSLSKACYTLPHEDKMWFWQDDERVEGSASNELTNVQKLYQLYVKNEFNSNSTAYVISQYITGIGTGNETEIKPADESLLGKGFGTGDYGVIAKTTEGIKQISEQCDTALDTIIREGIYDGINKLEFDVFGFSRGSAAARHFINRILMSKENPLRDQIFEKVGKKQPDLGMISGFDWNDNSYVEVTFAGLFDTVAAIVDFTDLDFSPHNDDNGDVKLWLDPNRVSRAIHLTANDNIECRKCFSVNKLNSSGHFHEFILPGAHSDIGGGYHSKMSYTDDNYLLPRLEKKLVKRIRYRLDSLSTTYLERKIRSKLEKYKNMEIQAGWHADDFGEIEIETRRINSEHKEMIGSLYVDRVVEGDLSRLYLRLMYGLAEYHQLPISDIDEKDTDIRVWGNNQYFRVPDKLTKRGGGLMNFQSLCDEVLSLAQIGEIGRLKSKLGSTDLLKELMLSNLIHHSSGDNISGHPFVQHGIYQRTRHDCEKNS